MTLFMRMLRYSLVTPNTASAIYRIQHQRASTKVSKDHRGIFIGATETPMQALYVKIGVPRLAVSDYFEVTLLARFLSFKII